MASRSMGASGATNAKVTLGTITPAVGRRSSCGNQVSSTDNSHPSYGFGASCLQTCLQQPIARIHASTCSAPPSAACAPFSIDSLPPPSAFAGTATRDTFAKRYISNQHVKVDPLDARTLDLAHMATASRRASRPIPPCAHRPNGVSAPPVSRLLAGHVPRLHAFRPLARAQG